MSRLLDIKEVVALLAQRIERLCAEILPAGVRDGAEWRVGSVQGEAGKSLAVHLSGDLAGVWADFSTVGDKGDALDLIAKVCCGGDKKAAWRWALAWLGLTNDPGVLAQARKAARVIRAEADRNSAERAERSRRGAVRLWLEAQPSIAGTMAEEYLIGRAIDLRRLGAQPGCLRFHPSCAYWEQGRRVGAWPAMVATIVTPEGKTVAVHRTWLARDRAGRVVKAPIGDAKKSWGRYLGGFISLWKGRHPSGRAPHSMGELTEQLAGAWVDPDTGEVIEQHCDNTVWITEGIEDGLTVACWRPRDRVVAGVSASNIANLALPPAIATVVLVLQNEGPRSKAPEAIAEAVERFEDEGRAVDVIEPPADVKDVNELAQQEARREQRA